MHETSWGRLAVSGGRSGRLGLVSGHDRLAVPSDNMSSNVGQRELGIFVVFEGDIPAIVECVLALDGHTWAILTIENILH